jgi:hypothetical protein
MKPEPPYKGKALEPDPTTRASTGKALPDLRPTHVAPKKNLSSKNPESADPGGEIFHSTGVPAHLQIVGPCLVGLVGQLVGWVRAHAGGPQKCLHKGGTRGFAPHHPHFPASPRVVRHIRDQPTTLKGPCLAEGPVFCWGD